MSKVKPIVATTPEDLAGALGLPAAAAKEWQLQRLLLKRLRAIVSRQNITHVEIATRSGASRTRVTAILNGNLDHVSSDLLVRILAALGYSVRISVVKSPAAAWIPLLSVLRGTPVAAEPVGRGTRGTGPRCDKSAK